MLTRSLLAAALAAAVLAGCGGDDSSSEKTTPGTTASTTATGAGTGTTQTAAGREAMPPEQLLAEMRRDLAKVTSYHVEGTGEDDEGKQTLTGDVSAKGDVQFTLEQDDGRAAQIIMIGPATYLKANTAYWKETGKDKGAQLAKVFADKWVKMPTSALGSSAKVFERLLPKTLAKCAVSDGGTLTSKGAGEVDGAAAVILAGDGSKPGTSKGEIAIAATGPALPLQVRQLSPRKPGGKIDPVCDDPDDDDDTVSSDLRFSRFDAPVDIAAPPDALDLEQLDRSTGTQA